MENLAQFLTPIEISIDNLLLDPNNPRFAELTNSNVTVPENRFSEPRIQKDAYDKMKTERFEVSELRDTMKTIGFLPMDRIVVREWKNNQPNEDKKYVLVEGNRRITALKWLLDLHATGKESLSQDQLKNFSNIESLLLDDQKAPSSSLWILPGLRHVSGIKEWGPYQKARAVYQLRESGSNAQEAAQGLGLSTRAANQLWRSYLALEQMKDDEEYGEHAEPKMYSYFEEIFKKPNVKDWLSWSDAERKFTSIGNLKELYSWIVGEPDDSGEQQAPKLPEAKSIRELGQFIGDNSALAVFKSHGGTLSRALARYEVDHPEDWKPIITKAESVLTSLSPDTLRSFQQDDIHTLEKLNNRVTVVLNDRAKLAS